MKSFLEQIDPYTFLGSAVIVGILLANDLKEEEQNSIGNWLQLAGLTIQTYASQVSVADTNTKKEKRVHLETIQKSLEKMQKELEKIQKKEA